MWHEVRALPFQSYVWRDIVTRIDCRGARGLRLGEAYVDDETVVISGDHYVRTERILVRHDVVIARWKIADV